MSRRQTSSSAAALTLNISPLCCAAVAVSMVNGEVGFVHRLNYNYFSTIIFSCSLCSIKFWKMKEGFAFGAGLIVVGLALQFSVGPIHWSDFAFPLNGIFLFLFLCSLGLVYVLRHKVRFFGFFHRVEAAVPILLYAAALTVAMGLTRQVPAHERAVDPIGLTQMLSFWPLCSSISRWRLLWD